MTLARFKELATIPGVVVALVVAILWLIEAKQTGARLDSHVIQEKVFHQSTVLSDSVRGKRTDSAMAELHGHIVTQDGLLRAMVRGECVENSAKDLTLQGLLATCRAMGINP